MLRTTKTKCLANKLKGASSTDHQILNIDMLEACSPQQSEILLGMGCFWGAERVFYSLPGVVNTAVGYAGGITDDPSYEAVCTGNTEHAEVVRIVFDPRIITLSQLLKVFFEKHDPTQGMRQGGDVGTQYRSMILTTTTEMADDAAVIKANYAEQLKQQGKGNITTVIEAFDRFYFAEEYHQQYLYKNPNGYCGIGGTGIECPI